MSKWEIKKGLQCGVGVRSLFPTHRRKAHRHRLGQTSDPKISSSKVQPENQSPVQEELGEPRTYDPEFKGPIYKRSCTDVLCCLFFTVVIFGYVLLGLLAWTYGDAKKVAYATDSHGEFCGQRNTNNEKKRYLFYFNILRCANLLVLPRLQCPTRQICVSECPDRFLTLVDAQKDHTDNGSQWEYYRQYCKPGFNDPLKPILEVFRDNDCPAVIFPSRPFLKRCLPDFRTINGILTVKNKTMFLDGVGKLRNVTELWEGVNGVNMVLMGRTIGMRVFEDFVKSWHWILIGLILAMISSLLFLMLLKYTAGVILWIFVFGVVILIAYGIWACYSEFHHLHTKPGSPTLYEIGFQSDLRAYLKLKHTWLIFMILLCILEVIVLLALLFLRKRIQIAVALLKEASKTIGHIPHSLFFPLVTFFLVLMCIAYCIVIAVFLATTGEAIYKVRSTDANCKYINENCDPETFQSTNISNECPGVHCTFAFYGGKAFFYQYVLIFHIFNGFVFLWLANFSIALGQCTLAGAFASYYWAFQKPDDIPPHPICAAFGRALRYHTGSLAFGSLILSVVQFLRLILEYLDRRLKGKRHSFAKFLLCCLKCCFWCLEKFLKFINRNTYIMIAIYGENFCASAKDAFMLVMRNVVRVAVLDKVTEFTLWTGKMLISAGIGILGFLFFTKSLPFSAPTLNYYWIPLLVTIFGSYLIAHGFFSVFAMCVDTLFLCFCEDLERNDGSLERPYYMSPKLLQILGKKQVTQEN
ncbi:choline transporter-like protein 5 [Antechinus flavipes]|uniref:choline transporter-like protein 5 n=1 Tax=Antechinus flavipes TaxID=38775 RepID=UPI00223565F4|nr:choline transporter-like protein 5 [Antechinus flavipes]